MRKILFFLLIIVVGYSFPYHGFCASERYYADQLRAAYLYNKGELDEALKILESMKKSVNDPEVYGSIANIYISKGDFNKAESILNEGLKRFDDAELLFKLGILYAKIYKNCEKATPYLESARKHDNKPTYALALAECYEEKSDYSKAIELYDDLTKRDKNPEYYYRKGVLYTKLNLLEKAKQEYTKAINEGRHLKASLNLAEIYIMEKKYDEAISLLNSVLTNYGDIVVAEERLAEIYKQMGDVDKALEGFKSIVGKLEGKPKALILKQIGLLYIDKRDFKDALDAFLKSTEINPLDYQALYFAGFSSELLKDYKGASSYYKRVLEIRDDFPFAKKRLAIAYINLKEFDKAAAILNGFTEKDIDVEYYLIKSFLYKEQNKLDQALAILNDAMRSYPKSPELFFELASLYEERKEYDKCEEILKQALTLEPENPIFLNFLGYLYAELNKKLDEAYMLVNRALQKDPDNPAYIDSMAWVLYKMKKYDEAYKWQKKALKYDPQEEEFLKHMEAIKKSLGIKKDINEILKED